MTDRPAVTGSWPGKLVISRGWARAEARPWNDDEPGAQVRLVRGSADFLGGVTRRLSELGMGPIYSPALYPSALRAWHRAGYDTMEMLGVMERSLHTAPDAPARVTPNPDPPWEQMLEIDRASFQGLWRMGRLGLEEAVGATRRATVLTVTEEDRAAGFVIVGSAQGVAYLQRLAVRPEMRRRGIGSDLVQGAIAWGRRTGARVLVLNVKPGSGPARRLYEAQGFAETGTRLHVMRWQGREPY